MVVTRQLFWLGLGATAGVLVYRRAARVAEAMRPENVAHSMAGACLETGYAVREFMADVREGMDLRSEQYVATAADRQSLPPPPGARTPRALPPGPRVAPALLQGTANGVST